MSTMNLNSSTNRLRAFCGTLWHRQGDPVEVRRLLLSIVAAIVFFAAPIEGYLIALHPQLGKVPAALLFAVWILVRFRLQPKPVIHIIYVLLATMAAIVLASTTMHLTDSFATVYAMRWIPFLLLTAVLVDVASSQVRIRWLLSSAVAGATVAALGALYSFVVEHQLRAAGPLPDSNDLAYVLVAAFPLTVLFSPRRVAARVALFTVITVITIATIATLSRGGLMALAAVSIWLLVRRAVPGRAVIWAGLTVGSAGLIGGFLAWPFISNALAEKQYVGDANVDSRLFRWEAAARMLATQPLLGTGPGGFINQYAAASRLAELDVSTQGLAGNTVVHNMYLEVAAEFGVLGFMVFLGLITTGLVSTELALRMGADRRIALALQASLIGIVIASFFLSEEYYFALWSTIATACALSIRAAFGDRG